MINPSEENLLGYLIRANEEHEQEALAEQIRTDAKLRKDCQILQSGLALPAADEEHLDPPSALAKETCCKLWSMVDSGEFPKLPALTKQSELAISPASPAVANPLAASLAAVGAVDRSEDQVVPSQDNTLSKPRGRLHWLDLAVAGSVLVVIGGVLSTQVLQSRTSALRQSCQNNLQLLHVGLTDYASLNGNRLPTAAEQGPLAFAGMFGPTLRNSGHLRNERTLICPESALAKQTDVQLPTLVELQRATPVELPVLQRRAGGTYSFTLGYIENGKYQTIRLEGQPNFALMSDPAASDRRPDLHHGQRGQNVLLKNGSVRFITECQLEGCHDNHFLNDAGEVGPGNHAADAVLVGSGVGPTH